MTRLALCVSLLCAGCRADRCKELGPRVQIEIEPGGRAVGAAITEVTLRYRVDGVERAPLKKFDNDRPAFVVSFEAAFPDAGKLTVEARSLAAGGGVLAAGAADIVLARDGCNQLRVPVGSPPRDAGAERPPDAGGDGPRGDGPRGDRPRDDRPRDDRPRGDWPRGDGRGDGPPKDAAKDLPIKPDIKITPVTTWKLLSPRYTEGKLNAVWSDGAKVFAVGDGGLVVRWDGTKWDVSSIGAADLRAVWGSSASDVYAVGGDLIQRWDGTKWNTTALTGADLRGVWGRSSPQEVYAVGGSTKSIVYRFDGSWNTLGGVPDVGPLYAVAGGPPNSKTHLVVAGATEVKVYTGVAWNQTFQRPDGVAGLAVSGDVIYAVNANGLFAVDTANPIGWTKLGPAGNAVAMSGTHVLTVGDSGSANDCDPKIPKCTPLEADTVASRALRGVWASSTGDVWAAGDGGTLIKRTSGKWASVNHVSGLDLNAVHANGMGDAVIAGDKGTVLELDKTLPKPEWFVPLKPEYGQTWNKLNGIWTSPWSSRVIVVGQSYAGSNAVVGVMENAGAWDHTGIGGSALRAVAGSASMVIAVGENGTRQHYSGQWSSINNPPVSAHLNAIAFASSAYLAVGAGGAAYAYASGWKGQSSAGTTALISVAADGSDFIAGASDGKVYRFANGNWSPLPAPPFIPRGLWSGTQGVYAVGNGGQIARLAGGGWATATAVPTKQDLKAVSGDANYVYVVGANGVVLRGD
jgi:hypothetical protein